MREKHPIDEQFKALYDAEATPPEEVRAAIGHRLGWNKSVGSGASLPSTLLLLVGLAGAALAWYHWSDITPTTKQQFAVVQEQQHLTTTEPAAPYDQANTDDVAVAAEPTNKVDGVVADQAELVSEDPEDGITATTTEGFKATKRSAVAIPASISDTKQSTTPAIIGHGTRSISTARKKENVAVASTTQDVENEAGSTEEGPVSGSSTTGYAQPSGTNAIADNSNREPTSRTVPKTDDPEQPVFSEEHISSGAWVGPILGVDQLETRLTLLDGEATVKLPFNSTLVEDYVIPSGNWWVSIYGGLSSVKGKWSGIDAEALDRSEQWKTGWQAGAMVGRAWRSGLGVGIGAGVARIHSTFSDVRSSISGEAADLDTAWTTSNYPGTQISISTWFIDTTFTPILGPQERTTANNQYTAIQVPLSLWWHKDIRRWKLGATAGVMGWIPMKRQGLTLVRPTSDAEPAPTALSSPETEPRYGMQLHGNAGLSLGYMLCEQLTILVEPMISTPLYTGNQNTSLSLSRPTIQFRLQYEFHSRIQRSK